jgi:predicted AAA+ superfamily ATPase
MYFLRKAEKEILDLAAYFPAVVIVGPRQVGKTSLARHIANHLGGVR